MTGLIEELSSGPLLAQRQYHRDHMKNQKVPARPDGGRYREPNVVGVGVRHAPESAISIGRYEATLRQVLTPIRSSGYSWLRGAQTYRILGRDWDVGAPTWLDLWLLDGLAALPGLDAVLRGAYGNVSVKWWRPFFMSLVAGEPSLPTKAGAAWCKDEGRMKSIPVSTWRLHFAGPHEPAWMAWGPSTKFNGVADLTIIEHTAVLPAVVSVT
jgi:hypothetical protein